MKALLSDVGSAVLFAGEVLASFRRRPPKRSDVFRQIWLVTTQSALTTALAGFFVGAVMALQFALQIKGFGALGYLGGLATSGTVREVGPLLIAFMLSGKVGAYTSAELGTMRVTEQIDAIRCLGAHPIQVLISPRIVAIVVASFFLLAAGLLASVLGGISMGVAFAGISVEEYTRMIPVIVTWSSVAGGLFKCLVFAVVLAWICTYKGYTASGGAPGVGRAVIQTAVATMVSLVIADWLTTVLWSSISKQVVGL
jgi:phospholipid/cholesterol/gamma-HCH transport system permease protein